MRKTLATLVIILVVAAPSPQTQALAISDVELKSYLNQPLEARITLLNANLDELNSLKINIDMIEDISNRQQINLMYEIKQNENGHYISITSEDVIREPVLNFSLELNWSEGHLIREYSILIDPR